MPWVEVFVAFVVCHLAGDFVLQTDWQARHKHGGLWRSRPLARRALFTHVTTYTLAFVPAFVWLGSDLGVGVIWTAALVFVPHLVQDDGRLLDVYMRRIKGLEPEQGRWVDAMVDQSLHLLALFGLALLVAAAT
jgi:hypothetical protein